jgi:hypothetical protein
MGSNRRKASFVAGLTAVGLLVAAAVQAQPAECHRINVVPFTISRPGNYCLVRSLSTAIVSGAAVTIAASDVVLDLQGFTLDGSAAGDGTETYGIRADGRRDVRVRNGIVRGFFTGITLCNGSSSQGCAIEGITAENNTYGGIGAGGRGALVRGNRVIRTGGSTSAMASGHAVGIELGGAGSRALDNDVVDTLAAATTFAWGIHVVYADGAVVEDNRVSGGSGLESFGIIVPFSQDVLVVDNRVARTTVGVAYTSGATGPYRDNLTSGVTTPYFGSGTDAGNNH